MLPAGRSWSRLRFGLRVCPPGLGLNLQILRFVPRVSTAAGVGRDWKFKSSLSGTEAAPLILVFRPEWLRPAMGQMFSKASGPEGQALPV